MIMLAVFLFCFSSGFLFRFNQLSTLLREIATVTIWLFRFDEFFFYFLFIFIIVTSVKNRRRFPTDELCSVVPWVPNKNASAQLESKHGQELAQSETERSSASEGSHAPASRALRSVFLSDLYLLMIHQQFLWFIIVPNISTNILFFKSSNVLPKRPSLTSVSSGHPQAEHQISAPNGLVHCDFSVVPDSFFLFSENSQIFFGRFISFSQICKLFFLLLITFSLFAIKITHFFSFRKKITAFQLNSKIFDNRIYRISSYSCRGNYSFFNS